MPQFMSPLTFARPHLTLDQCILDWKDAKFRRSESLRTRDQYDTTLFQFRAALPYGLDLDADPACIASCAEEWASTGVNRLVSASTFNLRLSILSSFYSYAVKQKLLEVNPVERIDRRIAGKTQAARPLPSRQVKAALADIDRESAEGMRDHALLSVALATGRRADELVRLRYGDIAKDGAICTIFWPRCKGNVKMKDVLTERTTTVLYSYLYGIYGSSLSILAADAPVWVSFSDRNRWQPIGYKTLARICKDRLGTSKVHATRHTWAVTMHKRGASLAEIGRGLGHSNLKTTSDYLAEQLGYENAYASDLEDAFGI